MSDLNDSVNMSRWSRLTTECRLWLHSAFTSNGNSCWFIFVVFCRNFLPSLRTEPGIGQSSSFEDSGFWSPSEWTCRLKPEFSCEFKKTSRIVRFELPRYAARCAWVRPWWRWSSRPAISRSNHRIDRSKWKTKWKHNLYIIPYFLHFGPDVDDGNGCSNEELVALDQKTVHHSTHVHERQTAEDPWQPIGHLKKNTLHYFWDERNSKFNLVRERVL